MAAYKYPITLESRAQGSNRGALLQGTSLQRCRPNRRDG